MNQCALCAKLLTPETDSREHLIPNAVGGRRKVAGFICEACNSETGKTWDKELAVQLNPISLLLGISRERGHPPAQEFEIIGGGSIVHESDGSLSLPKPIFEKTQDKDGAIRISITGRDLAETKRMLEGVKGKHPQVDVDATMKGATQQSEYLKGLVKISLMFGGGIAGRSIVKTALALAVSAGIPADACTTAIEYLRNHATPSIWEFYYAGDLITNRPAGVALHCVAIHASGGRLVGYVEYFGFRRMWVLLSDHYSAPDIQVSYAIDPVLGIELNLEFAPIPLAWHHSSFEEISGPTTTALTAILAPAVQAAKDRELNRVLRQAWDRACEQTHLPPGASCTPQQQWKFAEVLAKETLPFLEHQLHDPFKDFKPS
jgi:hypothetical protein